VIGAGVCGDDVPVCISLEMLWRCMRNGHWVWSPWADSDMVEVNERRRV
jgi:hypothetical protein